MSPLAEIILLVFAVLLAFVALRARDLLVATFVLGGYSYILCLTWTEMGAVDVALTEAAVGAGASAAFFIAAVHRTKRFAAAEGARRGARWLAPLGLLTTVAMGVLLVVAMPHLPTYGDPGSPAAAYVTRYYIENTLRETAVPNLVTALLADYRGYDTMFETTVTFLAGTCVAMLLRRPHRPRPAGATRAAGTPPPPPPAPTRRKQSKGRSR